MTKRRWTGLFSTSLLIGGSLALHAASGPDRPGAPDPKPAAKPDSVLGRYLTALFGPPSAASGDVLGWRELTGRRVAW